MITERRSLQGFAERLQMATTVDEVLIIREAGETRRKAGSEVISVFTWLRANSVGVVLNQMSQDTTADGYSYYGNCRHGDYQESEP